MGIASDLDCIIRFQLELTQNSQLLHRQLGPIFCPIGHGDSELLGDMHATGRWPLRFSAQASR